MKKVSKPKRRVRREGSCVVWPVGCEERFGLSAVTRWRWERAGKLPPRDVRIGNRTGWKPETLDAVIGGAA